MGEHTVKNITEPVRVYRMRVGPEAGGPGKKLGQNDGAGQCLGAAEAVLILVIGAVAIWNFYFVLHQ